ncbi:MAG: tRNA uridine-5-carboxymethylaminomethyl(34) synthesis GTPase MnmE, partial [Oscillospiraceae bacterium]|nr:tRNA uridine-5-carboxymethylaminomethyl(34) synthesis GTPase MnmE [Oscillospiraceae bacterium]
MSDTIAAIATPQQPSAIGILRLSGPDTRAVLEQVFRAKNGQSAAEQIPRAMVLGDLLDSEGRLLDNVLCVYFPGPDSYTGEDCAELHCHGSPVVLNEGLRALFAAGARQARGGEFTQRAFLNGRMDLIQAEAVIDLIDAETAEAARNAVGQVSGSLSRLVDNIYNDIMGVVSRFYAVVDYPDEDIEEHTRQEVLDTLDRAKTDLTVLAATFSRGQLLKAGVPTVILGKPNAGKSSLLNALLGYDRAIVTDVAGTTRDTVEEKVRLGNVLLRLIDTAGIRDTGDAIERQGVVRSRAAAAQAALALLVLDGSAPLDEEDEAAMAVAETVAKVLAVVNKADLPQKLDT